jgi:hypothetical protein
MCPVCITTAALIAGGGLAAIAIKFGLKTAVDNHPAPTPSKEDHHG